MTKDIMWRFLTIALLVLFTAAGASCVPSNSETPVWAIPSPSAVPDPHPTTGMG